MRAIDLYAGVGGWAVGLKMAKIDLVCSYEWWQPAADTHHANSNSKIIVADIRKLDMSNLPKDIDLVVGSPPCTQFSYSNRGGSGNIADGLLDIKCFLNAIRKLKPKFWVFENVPRVKSVIETELSCGSSLNEYRDLLEEAEIEIFDMANFGIPQRRKRCIVGNFNFTLLQSYAKRMPKTTLGDVVEKLADGLDPCFKIIESVEVLDNEKEAPLNWEEERFNREMKVSHPIYNGMPFPDPLDRTSRTVTATCTRVSRESLIVLDAETKKYRRLSVRERASLQSFPASFQFQGKSHAEKLKMVGNAIPPMFTYLIAEAIKKTKQKNLILPSSIDANGLLSKAKPIKTNPDKAGKSYPSTRRFRFAIPNLRFKSGTRFELANIDGPDAWGVGFYFGDSKRIERRNFTTSDLKLAAAAISGELHTIVSALYERTSDALTYFDLTELQSTWARETEDTHPFDVIDMLGKLAKETIGGNEWDIISESEIKSFVFSEVYGPGAEANLAKNKITSLVLPIAIGMTIAAATNAKLRNRICQIAAE